MRYLAQSLIDIVLNSTNANELKLQNMTDRLTNYAKHFAGIIDTSKIEKIILDSWNPWAIAKYFNFASNSDINKYFDENYQTY